MRSYRPQQALNGSPTDASSKSSLIVSPYAPRLLSINEGSWVRGIRDDAAPAGILPPSFLRVQR